MVAPNTPASKKEIKQGQIVQVIDGCTYRETRPGGVFHQFSRAWAGLAFEVMAEPQSFVAGHVLIRLHNDRLGSLDLLIPAEQYEQTGAAGVLEVLFK